jgi:leader peptidase (prepilin peptidase)/N-methyltransferase
VVAATAVVLALLAWRIGWAPELAAYLYLGAVGVPLAFIDVALKRLPDPLTLPSYVIGAALLGLAMDGPRFTHALIGMVAGFVLYAVQWVIVPGQLGLGDVKLAGVLGLYLGWLGRTAWFTGVLAGFLFGGGYALALLVTRRAGRKSTIPFGPFMLAGALAGILLYA